ncbi:hypothetical protein CVS40_5893 [Lucilia cuprina]|nr:hypothetical protein CVS40_5893 [Lucilia cuprina]
MVLTRSNRNQLGTGDTVVNVENMKRSTDQTIVPNSVKGSSAPNTNTVTTSMAPIAPSVQQFMTLAQDRTGGSNDSSVSNVSITTPEYSSITARNVQQEYRQNAVPAQSDPTSNNRAVTNADLIREEVARQTLVLQNTLQEITRAVSRLTAPTNPPNMAQNTVYTNPTQLQSGGQRNIGPQQLPSQHPYSFPVQEPQQPYMQQQTPYGATNNQQPNSQQAPIFASHSSPAPSLPPEFTFTNNRKIDLSKV